MLSLQGQDDKKTNLTIRERRLFIMEDTNRAGFSSKIGFILAAAASAVGLGNIWRFPYLAAEYGGGMFLIVYLVLAVTFGFSIMITEVAIGRKTQLSAIGAFRKLNKKFAFCGWLALLIPVIITPYYSVIGGWVAKYMVTYITGQGSAAASDGFFGAYIGGVAQPILWLLVFVIVTCVVVLAGVQKGIEKASIILMPILIALCLVIGIYGLTQPGALDGLAYYVKPNLHKFSGKLVLAALGQLFYSMSLAMGIMITYGSYMKKEANLESSVRWIEVFDTVVAFLAGLMIVPSVYAFSGGNEEAMNSGPGLMFVTLPSVFESMPAGHIIGGLFFVLVFFAALTSAISLTETIASVIMDKLHWRRAQTVLLVGIFVFVVGIPSSLGFGVWSHIAPLGMDLLTFFDFISNSVMMPVLAFFTCIFAADVLKPKAIIEEVETLGVTFKAKKFYSAMIRFVAPVGIVAILISSVLAGLGVFSW